MTEAEWLAATDPSRMMEFLRGKTTYRRLHLLVVGCCQRIWNLLPPVSRSGVEALELSADGLATSSDLRTTLENACAEAEAADNDPPGTLTYSTASVCLSYPPTTPSAASCMETAVSAVACDWAENSSEADYDSAWEIRRTQERFAQAHLLLDIFGNPFRPIAFIPEWRTSTVVSIARIMYDSRDFATMPVLADALQDAGCENEDILNHCRSGGPHVRGCWVVDLILGKE